MSTNKQAGRIVGALLLSVMFSALVGNEYIGSIINSPDFLTTLYQKKAHMLIGAFFEMIDLISVIGITVILFPIFKKTNESLALGYVGIRICECTVLICEILCALVLITVSEEFIAAGTPASSFNQSLGTIIVAARAHWSLLLLTGFYSVGALIFYGMMYTLRLIPRLLSIWGLVAVSLSLVDRFVFEYSGYNAGTVSGLPISGLHLGLIEIILGIWLIAKGFNSSETIPE